MAFMSFPRILAVLLMLFYSLPLLAGGIPVFLMGEDVHAPEQLVLTVNAVQRKGFTGSLMAQNKQDVVEVGVAVFNNGKQPQSVDPATQFSFELNDRYTPADPKTGNLVLFKSFTVHPGTVSRGNLYFFVRTDDQRSQPRLVFDAVSQRLEIVCNPELARLFEKRGGTQLDGEEVERLGRFLIDAERMDEAANLVRAAMERFPSSGLLRMQYAAILKWQGRSDEAGQMLAQIVPDSLTRDDALTFARQAFDLSQFAVCRQVLEPVAAKGQLNDRELVFLARCWYFDREYERAERLLKDLFARGQTDKTITFTLGNIAEKREDLRGAIEWWTRTMNQDSQHYEALFNIGVAYYKLNERDRAVQCWKRVLDLSPDVETRQVVLEALKQVQ